MTSPPAREAPELIWVEVEWTFLTPPERSAHIPAETRAVPYKVRARGTVEGTASFGQEAIVTLVTGRLVHGRIVAVNPGYTHTFGLRLPVLTQVQESIRRALADIDP
jgi:hypothetical protein